MKELYREFFHVPENGKIREKVMLTRISVSIAIVVLCLFAMSFSAYAYFTSNASSEMNVVEAASFDASLNLRIVDSYGNVVESITPPVREYKTLSTNALKVGKWYTVTITPSVKNTAKTGFVVVSAKNCNEVYHTQQLGVDESVPGGKTESITFRLMITAETRVFFLMHWGTSSHYDDYRDRGTDDELYIIQNEDVKLVVNGIVNPPVFSAPPVTETPEPEKTEPVTTEPVTTEPETPAPSVTEPALEETPVPTEPEVTEKTEPEATPDPVVTEPALDPQDPPATTPAAEQTDPIEPIADEATE